MAQSVKLKDGSYIDATGIYDTTRGKTQETLNQLIPFVKIDWSGNRVTDIDNNHEYGIFLAAASTCTSGTLPTGLGGNGWLIIHLNIYNNSYSAQMAFGFAADKIAIRRKNGSTTWGAWKYIT